MYPSKTCYTTISYQYHGLGHALETLKPERIVRVALNHYDVLPFLIKGIAMLSTKNVQKCADCVLTAHLARLQFWV